MHSMHKKSREVMVSVALRGREEQQEVRVGGEGGVAHPCRPSEGLGLLL